MRSRTVEAMRTAAYCNTRVHRHRLPAGAPLCAHTWAQAPEVGPLPRLGERAARGAHVGLAFARVGIGIEGLEPEDLRRLVDLP